MANNIAVTEGAGKTVASEDVGGFQYQKVKLIVATAGSSTPVGDATTPLQVSLANTGANSNKLLVTPDANSAVNVAQLAGTTTDTNSGAKSAGTLRVVLATDQPALTNKLLVTPDSVALPANQSVNAAQVGGTNTDTNSGAKSAGTLRVVLATDQPQLTNKLLVTPDANSAVNLAQVNGSTTSVNIGASDAGTLRVALAYDGAVTVQASQVSGVTNATTSRTTTTGLGPFVDAAILVNITNAGAVTGVLQLFLEDSFDGGTTWNDLVSSNTFTFGAALTTQQFYLCGRLAPSTGYQGVAQAVETLAAGTVRYGPFGDRLRVREKVSGVGGSPTGVTYTITAVFKR